VKWNYGVIVFLAALYSVATGTARYGFLVSIIAGVLIGTLFAGFLRLIGFRARRIRVNNPKPWMRWTGSFIYWIGCALGVYLLGLTLYMASQYDGTPSSVSATSLILGAAVFWWAMGWVIRYLLGHEPRRSEEPDTSESA